MVLFLDFFLYDFIQEEDTPIADSHKSSQGAHAYEQGMESSEGIK